PARTAEDRGGRSRMVTRSEVPGYSGSRAGSTVVQGSHSPSTSNVYASTMSLSLRTASVRVVSWPGGTTTGWRPDSVVLGTPRTVETPGRPAAGRNGHTHRQSRALLFPRSCPAGPAARTMALAAPGGSRTGDRWVQRSPLGLVARAGLSHR